MTQKLPLVLPSTAPANPNCSLPRYYAAGVAGDWAGGQSGNDVNAASASVAVVNAASATPVAAYAPTSQVAKGNGMTPALSVLGDLGKDYGAYTGLTGRTGTIQPREPYPTAALE